MAPIGTLTSAAAAVSSPRPAPPGRCHPMTTTPTRRLAVLLFLFGFSVAYCQAPLYYSNQNQYFVHGLAQAGRGFLADDWLATTADPTPVFSALVAFTVRYLHPWLFHVYYALILGVYAAS